MNYLMFFVLSVSVLTSDACQFGSEAIQRVYDRFELFKKAKSFDPANATVPLENYFFINNNGEKRLSVQINGVYIMELYKSDEDNQVQTISGQYEGRGGVNLNYMRDENGAFSFDDWSNHKRFKSSLRSIDAELPNDFEEDYKQILVDLNAMRKKMFDYHNGLIKEDLERVRSFKFSPLPNIGANGDGFFAEYVENAALGVTVSKYHNSDDIFGTFLCENQDQKYKIIDGKVVADGEPFVPFNTL
ncbi:uncharacterized protein LOC119075471 [Bradysia coprophila]|uniref:uncharacterized protein LOC119075471 n=1 Tax=Bradysia coprophila TaxID=38358 RepID=UPI00187DB9A7|nr:uncharacterized protein LOC119075471 [Bradysia coprophila]